MVATFLTKPMCLKNWRRGRDSIIAISSKSWWFLHIAIIPCVYDGFQAHSRLRVGCLRRPLTTCIAHRNDITGITPLQCIEVCRTHGCWSLSVIASRVENRRSNFSLPVDSRLGFRLITAVRFGLVLFPVPAHRTGQADFPHPTLGKDTRCS